MPKIELNVLTITKPKSFWFKVGTIKSVVQFMAVTEIRVKIGEMAPFQNFSI